MHSSTIVAALAGRSGLGSRSWPEALVRPIQRGISRIGYRRKLRRHANALRALDEHLLNDTGLRPGEIEYLAEYGAFPSRLHED
jgi:uncharacterized protein YjiS (DUF1127 family)